jgi:hypothetical protein
VENALQEVAKVRKGTQIVPQTGARKTHSLCQRFNVSQ